MGFFPGWVVAGLASLVMILLSVIAWFWQDRAKMQEGSEEQMRARIKKVRQEVDDIETDAMRGRQTLRDTLGKYQEEFARHKEYVFQHFATRTELERLEAMIEKMRNELVQNHKEIMAHLMNIKSDE